MTITEPTSLIRRTYNRHGGHDYLIRMEGGCPVWSGDRRQALRLSEASARSIYSRILDYRDWLCPDGISGVEIVEA